MGNCSAKPRPKGFSDADNLIPELAAQGIDALRAEERAAALREAPASQRAFLGPDQAAAAAARPELLVAGAAAAAEARAGFAAKVFSILAAEAMWATLVALPFALGLAEEAWMLQHIWLLYLTASTSVAMLVAGALFGQEALHNSLTSCSFLFVLASLAGVSIGFTCALFSLPSVIMASASAAAILACLAAFAGFAGSDLEGTPPYLFAVFAGVATLGALLIFVDAEIRQKIYGVCGAVLVSFLFVGNMQQVVRGQHRVYQFLVDDYSVAALILHFDAVDLFQALPALFRGVPQQAGRWKI